MNTKKIFILSAFVLFILSGVGGYFAPGIIEARQEERLRQSFTPPEVPADVVAAFSRSFNDLSQATEAKFLPEDVFVSIDGKDTKIADFEGKPTLFNVWATWCAPCVVELPHLQKLQEHYKDRMNVVALSLDEGKTPAQIADFLEKRQISDFAGYLDQNGTIMKKLGIRGIPTSFLIGRDGLILYRFEGDADWTSEESKAFFDAFLLQNK